MQYPIVQPVEQLYLGQASFRARPKSRGNYVQACNITYAEAFGVGLVMDVFRPRAAANGRAVVDVIGGAWHAGRQRLNEHLGLGLVDALCERGFTVFAVSPGSANLFTAHQMAGHVHAAVRYVRWQADTWGVAREPLGLAGASASGHIAALAAISPDGHTAAGRDPWSAYPASVQAVGLFFPPTDLADFDGQSFDFSERAGHNIGRLLCEEGVALKRPEEIRELAEAASPARQVNRKPPPFLLIHGDADPVVPLSQSEKLRAALRAAGGEVRLLVKPGGGHPWPDARVEAERMAEWFQERLV